MKDMIKSICEKILSLREEISGLLVRLQGVAMLTHLQRSCSLLQMFALIVRSAGTGVGIPAPFAGRAPCAHLGSLCLREESVRSPHSPVPAPTGVGDAPNFYLPTEKKTKSVVVLRTKVLDIKSLSVIYRTQSTEVQCELSGR